MEKFKDWHLYTGAFLVVNNNPEKKGVYILGCDMTHVVIGGYEQPQYVDVSKLTDFGMPVLRRLESMTREENEKYDKWMDFAPDVSGGSFEIIKDMLHFRAYVDETRGFIDMYYVAQLVNELRKDGFDCDRLIESGQAIDAATLKDAGK